MEGQPQQRQPSPEEIEALKKKIEAMSPEELREFQKKQCVFCQIISGKVQSKKVYEDDIAIGVLDINPANPGHILLLPKEHYQIMPQLSEEEIAHLGMVSKALSNALLKALQVEGTNIFIANGIAAGQRAQHFMVHIIPRKEGDGVDIDIPENKVSDDDLEKIRERIAAKIDKTLGLKVKPAKVKKPRVLEAEFKEEKPEKHEKKAEKKGKGQKKKEKKEKPKRPKKEGIDLDDISRVLGV